MISKQEFENVKNFKKVERTRWSIAGIAAFLDDVSQTVFDHYVEVYGKEEAEEIGEVRFINMLTRLFDDLEADRTVMYAPVIENYIVDRFESFYRDFREF